jgi:hypothetical protein
LNLKLEGLSEGIEFDYTNHNLPQPTSIHHQFERTKPMEEDSNAPYKLPLTPTTIGKAKKTSRTHKVKKIQQNVNPKSHKNQCEEKTNKPRHFKECANSQTEQCKAKI